MVAHQLNQWASHNTKSNTEKSNLLHREHDKTNNTLVDESIFHSTLPAQKICAHALDHDQERDRPRFWYLLGIFSLFAWGACLGIYVLYAVENSGKEDQQDRRGIFGNYRITFTVMAYGTALMMYFLVLRELKRAVESYNPTEGPEEESSLRKFWIVSAFRIGFLLVIMLQYLFLGRHNFRNILMFETQSHHSNVTIQYNYLSEVDMGSNYAMCCNGLFSEYIRLLLSQGEHLHYPSDIYGNVKIPDLARLKGTYSEDDEEWTAIRANGSAIYSSLMGIPVSRVPGEGNTTFEIETSYYSVKCDNFTSSTLRDYWIIGAGDAISEIPIFNGPFSKTNTTFGLDSTASLSIATAGFQKLRWPKIWEQLRNNTTDGDIEEVEEIEAQPLLVQSTYYGSSIRYAREHRHTVYPSPVLAAYCTIRTHYISVKISCTPSRSPGNCTATSMRPSPLLHPNTNLTDFNNIRAFYEFTRDFMIAGRDGHADVYGDIIDGNTLTEYFLQDPYFGSNRDNWGSYGPYFTHPRSTPEEFEVRIQQVLNGFRMLQMGGTVVNENRVFRNTKNTTGDNVVDEEVVMLKGWPWTFVMFLTVVLIALGVMEVVACWRAQRSSVRLM